MNIHAKFTGEVAKIIEEIIQKGQAASKTEAIRLAVLDYKHHHFDREDADIRRLSAFANTDIWEDSDEDKIWAKYLKEEKK